MSVGILTGCESDKHLSEQILLELRKINIESFYINIKQNDIPSSYCNTDFLCRNFKFILAVGDRPEQIGGVLAAFQNKIFIGHLYAGDINPTISTYDDIHRHAITLYSNIQFCSTESSMINTREIMRHAGLVPNANLVGATHFDGINITEIEKEFISCRYHNNGKYVLVSLNSETLGNNEKVIEETVLKIKESGSKLIYLTEGNKDDNLTSSGTAKLLFKFLDDSYNMLNLGRVSHNYFIYLMLHCKEFITNSSCAIYEAPAILSPELIHIVEKRNSGRTPVPPSAHDGKASMRVAQLIKTFLETEK